MPEAVTTLKQEQARAARRLVVGAMILLGALGLGLQWTYSSARTEVLDGIVDVANDRVDSLRETISHSRSLVRAMQASMERDIQLAEAGARLAPAIDALAAVPDLDGEPVFSVEATAAPDEPQDMGDTIGTLSGSGDPGALSPRLRAEIGAALALNPLLQASLIEVPDALWVYYTSVDRFIMLAPGPPASVWHYSEDVYNKPFWTEAMPGANPDRRLVLSEVYEDGAGQGLLISFSAPVWVAGQFRGVASLDIGLGTLRRGLDTFEAIGESVLVDEDGKLAARISDFVPPVQLEIPADLTTDERRDGIVGDTPWFVFPVQAGELWLAHRVLSRRHAKCRACPCAATLGVPGGLRPACHGTAQALPAAPGAAQYGDARPADRRAQPPRVRGARGASNRSLPTQRSVLRGHDDRRGSLQAGQ